MCGTDANVAALAGSKLRDDNTTVPAINTNNVPSQKPKNSGRSGHYLSIRPESDNTQTVLVLYQIIADTPSRQLLRLMKVAISDSLAPNLYRRQLINKMSFSAICNVLRG
ncbi:hypothetical protein OnM2_012024, partial [Erysiphe neolycopersici]